MFELRYARYLTFALAACTVISNGLYLYYLIDHPMVRVWSGINGVLLGLFMVSWSVVMARSGGRRGAVAISLIGIFNVVVGFLFFR